MISVQPFYYIYDNNLFKFNAIATYICIVIPNFLSDKHSPGLVYSVP